MDEASKNDLAIETGKGGHRRSFLRIERAAGCVKFSVAQS